MSDLYGRAEKLLVGITPGPWKVTHYRYTETNARRLNVLAMQRRNPVKAGDIYKSEVTPVAEMEGNGEGGISNSADAEFIAAAPALVTDLLAECKRLEVRVEEESASKTLFRDAGGELMRERDEALAERDEAVKARWRTQDTLARVRDVAEQHSRLGISIGPDALLDGLNEGTDGGH